jgi:AcrR family transcriptional regulator
MSTVADARVVRSREALREAMVELAAELPLDAITVRAIAARAGVGYATFFRHYSDKETLLADVAGQLTQEFLAQVAPILRDHDRRGAARSLVAFVEAHMPIHRALLGGGAGETVRRQILDTVARARHRESEGAMDDLILQHMVSSILNLLSWWVRHPGDVGADTLAELIDRAVLEPVSALRQRPPS